MIKTNILVIFSYKNKLILRSQNNKFCFYIKFFFYEKFCTFFSLNK